MKQKGSIKNKLVGKQQHKTRSVRWGNEHPRTEDCLLFSPSGRVRAAATRETEFDFLVFPAGVHKDARG